MVDLGTLGGMVIPFALSQAGQVVGAAYLTGNSTARAFSWTSAGGLVDLGTLPGGSLSQAVAVNDAGQVAGSSRLSTGFDHAFSWTAGGGMVDLGTLGGCCSQIAELNSIFQQAINNAGQVVGNTRTLGDTAVHAFSWTSIGGLLDLGTLGGNNSNALFVNQTGLVVGYSQNVDGNDRAFAWPSAGGMIELGTLGGTLSFPYDVNDAGQVVGRARNAAGEEHAVLWEMVNTPAGPDVQATPVDAATGAVPASLTFSNVEAPGNTTLVTSDTGPAPLAGFQLGDPPRYYNLHTTAVFSGELQVCLDYSGIAFDSGLPELFHYESGSWVNVTTLVDPPNTLVCGVVTSLSPFAIFQPAPAANVPASSDQCKSGGWRGLERADGSSFSNQGACVRYVNTGR
jgi:probable HAF family extracellular repeat protein